MCSSDLLLANMGVVDLGAGKGGVVSLQLDGKPGVTARLLVIHAPAMDAYFAGLHELWNRAEPPTPDEERALMARFGMEAV